MSSSISVLSARKAEIIKNIATLKTLEKQYKAVDYYLKAVNRDGVPYHLIDQILPKLQDEVNAILTEISNFNVILETDGKNINGHIVYDDERFWPLELSSGMERFVSSLALRTALIKVTTLPKPDFLVIDEGFGVLSSNNLESMETLFNKLRDMFGFTIIVSHIDSMKDMVDSQIEIVKPQNRSKVSYP